MSSAEARGLGQGTFLNCSRPFLTQGLITFETQQFVITNATESGFFLLLLFYNVGAGLMPFVFIEKK